MMPLFGAIRNGEMHLNDLGRILEQEWLRTPRIRPAVSLDVYVIMPNHIHGILLIQDDQRTESLRPPDSDVALTSSVPSPPSFRPPSRTVGAVVRGFKGACTRQVNLLRTTHGTPLWHRNYHDHIIRNEAELHRIREYIVHNPQSWAEDRFHHE
jgi:REP element-mobilizing transposase RayT